MPSLSLTSSSCPAVDSQVVGTGITSSTVDRILQRRSAVFAVLTGPGPAKGFDFLCHYQYLIFKAHARFELVCISQILALHL
jgi:uncharacterized protein (DUF4213/DUF364 family)